MHYEVEQKYAVADLAAVEAALLALGARKLAPVMQKDAYYAHPARDFAETDEALRLRRVGDQTSVTYKGPKLDGETKTRREIELPLGPGTATGKQFAELLAALDFQLVREVRKRRQGFLIPWQDQEIEGALDEVHGLGNFVELELSADDDTLETAKAAIASLAGHLGLSRAERRSYLELLLG